MQLGSFNSLHTYGVNFFLTDRDGILIFACPQGRTKREEADKRHRADEDRKKAEAAKRQIQAEEEQEQNVTFQNCAVTLSEFSAYVSRFFRFN